MYGSRQCLLADARSAGPASGGERVLALVTDAFGGYGGISQYNRDLILALAATPEVARVDVLPRLAPGKLEELPASVRQHRPIHRRVGYALRAITLALRTRPTIIFNGHIYHGPLSHTIARLTGAKLLSQLHGTEIWGDLPASTRRPLEASGIVLTVSRDTRARLLAKANIEPERVLVLNNTIGCDFRPLDRHAARAKFHLTDEFAILTVARLDAREGYKGHDRIIPWIATMARDFRIRYLIAGVGDDRARLEHLAESHGIADRVTFLGKVPREDLPSLYRAADLFALPSTGEGFGIAFLEAMACGTPAIGLSVGGAPDALGEGMLGACVAEEELHQALSDALRAPPPDADALSTAVHERFGQLVFRAQVTHMLSRLH